MAISRAGGGAFQIVMVQRLLLLIAVLAASAASPHAAHAQPALTPPGAVNTPLAPLPPVAEPDERSPMLAFLISFVPPVATGTVLVLSALESGGDGGTRDTLLGIATVVLPSAGWLYADRPWHAIGTTGARFAALGYVLSKRGDETDAGTSGSILLLVFTGTMLFDWIGPPIAIRGDNRRMRAALVPTVHPGGGGLSLSGTW